MARKQDFAKVLQELLQASDEEKTAARPREGKHSSSQALAALLAEVEALPDAPTTQEEWARAEAMLARVQAWVAQRLQGDARREAEALLAVERERLARLRREW